MKAALEQFGVFRGAIVTPEDFAPFRGVSGEPFGLEGWAFAVPVSDTVGKAFWKATTCASSVGVLRSLLGPTFLSVTIQASGAQARIVVDLADSRVQRLLRWCAERGELKVIWSTMGRGPGRLTVFSADRTHIESVLGQTQTSRPLSPLHHAVALAAASYELTACDYLDSLDEGVAVTDVSVCTITPDASEICAMEGPGTATMH
jgi:hypothetical protein